jgi:RNA polymerase sigma-70 factor (ECF subfamily)
MHSHSHNYKELSDQILVERSKAGEHRAFEILMDRWQDSTYRLAWRYLGLVEESMDTVQNTFIKAWTNLPKMDNPAKFGPWVHQICRNQCLDHLRSSHHKCVSNMSAYPSSSVLTEEEANIESIMEHLDVNTPHSELERSQRKQIVHKALSSLPDEQMIIVTLKELEGLKFREISEMLKIPENTVKSRLYYGLSALRKYFLTHNLEQEVKSA